VPMSAFAEDAESRTRSRQLRRITSVTDSTGFGAMPASCSLRSPGGQFESLPLRFETESLRDSSSAQALMSVQVVRLLSAVSRR
jgi:hypothetical protein